MKMRLTFVSVLNFFAISFCLAQNVGIGIANPTRARFELNGAVDRTTAIFGGESTGIGFLNNQPEIGFNGYNNNGKRYIGDGYAAFQSLDQSTGYLSFDMSGYGTKDGLMSSIVRAITVSSTGRVGMGGALPNAELQLPNSINNRKLVLWETAIDDHQFYGFGIQSGTLTYNVGSTSNVHRFYAGNNYFSSTLLMSIWGNKQIMMGTSAGGTFVGINTDASSHTLTVRQAANTGLCLVEAASNNTWGLNAYYMSLNNYTSMDVKLNDNYVGSFQPSGMYNASDSRVKRNIQAMPSLLDKVMELQPKKYEYKYNNPNHEQSIGFIAEDVKKLFPEIVVVRQEISELKKPRAAGIR
jgi:hypothetical protein